MKFAQKSATGAVHATEVDYTAFSEKHVDSFKII
jgi:hypothetical protein